MPPATRPVPDPDESDAPYWDAARARQLKMPRCTYCAAYARRRPAACPRCHHEEFEWVELSGRGTIYSYTVARQTTTPGFEDLVPYVLVQVSLEEAPEICIMTNLVGEFDIDALDLDLPVVVDFEDRGEVTLPQFRLVMSSSDAAVVSDVRN